MIDITKLTDKDIGLLVVYNNGSNIINQQGRITSFNSRFIFVDYDNTGRGQATRPEDLHFVTQDKIVNDQC